MNNLYFYNYPICKIGIAEENGAICRVFFSNNEETENLANYNVYRETPLIKEAALQLADYFNCKRKTFDLPLAPNGTVFQINVWETLQKIPYGETRSYGEMAAMIGNSKACRAVGMANNRNPIVIIIPCHRVIGHDGSLTGYAGGLELKRKLLELEKLS